MGRRRHTPEQIIATLPFFHSGYSQLNWNNSGAVWGPCRTADHKEIQTVNSHKLRSLNLPHHVTLGKVYRASNT